MHCCVNTTGNNSYTWSSSNCKGVNGCCQSVCDQRQPQLLSGRPKQQGKPAMLIHTRCSS
uniref:Uncharacterized protein n=1 Tax=Rhizophora mucronata TaxID=61149 RepID=A0A2P2N4W1_RHIMU